MGRTCLPSHDQASSVTSDLSLLIPQVFSVRFLLQSPFPLGGGDAQAQQSLPEVPVALEDLSCQHLHLPQG